MDLRSEAPLNRFHLAWIAILLVGAQGAAQSPGPASPAQLERGKKIYNSTCAECHGPAGRGDGPKAKKMGFHPRDFWLGAFKCRCTPSGQLPSDADLVRTITRGMPGTPMQAHESKLGREEIEALLQFIKTLVPRFKTEPQPPCVAFPEAPVAAERSIAEGKQIYRVLQCWKCHGKSGKGDGPSSADLKDDWGQPIKAYNFTVLKKFKCGSEDRDLYRTLHTGMNGSPMPSYDAAFLFAREGVSDLGTFKNLLDARDTQELEEFLRQQPNAAALRGLSEPARRELGERRTWSLIHYVRSLLSPAK